jgi:phosphoribosylamine--glycine ligase
MKVLIVGGGGREHAIAWKLAQDSAHPELFCAPGNAGTAQLATNVPIAAEDVEALTVWAAEQRPDLTVIGPEAPLCLGLTDRLQALGLRVFGPSAAAAKLEGSKEFAKEVMREAGVPTAGFTVACTVREAREAVRRFGLPVVIKADGLAAGKGVYVCQDHEQAEAALDDIFVRGVFGDAGERAVIEEFLRGEEASILALVDGATIVPLSSSQDHKRVYNDDEGPNTGGMGAYSPAPVVTDALWPVIREQILEPTVAELRRRGIVYKGVLYAGLMIGPEGPKVLEFNCRFGDPETQAVLPRIDGDLLPALQACVDGTLSPDQLRWKPDPCVCVVMASGGYPGAYAKGKCIHGLEEAAAIEGTMVLHAGTALEDGRVVTSGGRVLGITALGADLAEAIRRAYRVIRSVTFDQAQYRTDIGARALNRR